MATYLILNLFVVGLIGVICLWRRRIAWKRLAVLLTAMLLLTALFDNLIILSRIVAYDPMKISGLLVAKAPVEDFAYAVAACLLLPYLWQKFRDKP